MLKLTASAPAHSAKLVCFSRSPAEPNNAGATLAAKPTANRTINSPSTSLSLTHLNAANICASTTIAIRSPQKKDVLCPGPSWPSTLQLRIAPRAQNATNKNAVGVYLLAHQRE